MVERLEKGRTPSAIGGRRENHHHRVRKKRETGPIRLVMGTVTTRDLLYLIWTLRPVRGKLTQVVLGNDYGPVIFILSFIGNQLDLNKNLNHVVQLRFCLESCQTLWKRTYGDRGSRRSRVI